MYGVKMKLITMISMVLTIFLMISCDDSNLSDKNLCGNCANYEQCNEETDKCELKNGMCGKSVDCTDNKPVCNTITHLCEAGEFKCDSCDSSYESCNLENTACILQSGKCGTKDDCTDQTKPLCDETHTCVSAGGTIYPVRTKNIDEGEITTVSGTITALQKNSSGTLEGIYIQEPGDEYRGIFIYINGGITSTLKRGDNIEVTGKYVEYFNFSEIKIENTTAIKQLDGNTPISISTTMNIKELSKNQVEPYESMLVIVRGDFVVTEIEDDNNNTINKYLIDAGDNQTFIIGSNIYDPKLTVGEKLTEVRGTLFYSYNDFRILPRDQYDLKDNTALCTAANCSIGEYCKVTNDLAECFCDNMLGYFQSGESCVSPCNPNPCTESNRSICTATDAINYHCDCDSGYRDDNGSCEIVPSCDPEIYGSALGKTGTSLEAALKTIASRNHVSYGYESAKNAMFSHIDNEGGKIRGVYTGEYYSHPYNDNRATQTKTNENEMNCEHTWPQSKGISGTSKADLHHLFPTFSYVNSKRGNHPFGDVTDGEIFGTSDYFSEMKNNLFEPADQHKGNVARAMLYMMVRYDNPSDFIDSNNQFMTFKAWDKLDPVDDAERTRNDLVETYQYNRNPFIDCPQFVDALYQ